jgi:hypothetical protein
MLKKGEYHYARDEAKYKAKMRGYQNFLESLAPFKKECLIFIIDTIHGGTDYTDTHGFFTLRTSQPVKSVAVYGKT